MSDTMEEQQDAQIARYLRQQMSKDEKAQFEIRMLDEPELLERVQLLEALQQELKADEKALLTDAADSVSNVLPFRGWLRQPLSLAASFLIAVLAAYNIYDEPPPGSGSFTALPVRSLVLLDDSRGESATPVGGAGPHLVQIDAGLDAESLSFGVSVSNESSQQILIEETGLIADNNGWVRLLLDELPPGDYRVSLNWQDAQGAMQSRSYRIHFGE